MNNPKIDRAVRSLNIWMVFISILSLCIIAMIFIYTKDGKLRIGEIVALMLTSWGWLAVLAIYINAKKAIKLLKNELENKSDSN